MKYIVPTSLINAKNPHNLLLSSVSCIVTNHTTTTNETCMLKEVVKKRNLSNLFKRRNGITSRADKKCLQHNKLVSYVGACVAFLKARCFKDTRKHIVLIRETVGRSCNLSLRAIIYKTFSLSMSRVKGLSAGTVLLLISS